MAALVLLIARAACSSSSPYGGNMGIAICLFLGLAASFFTSKAASGKGEVPLIDFGIGMAGALVGFVVASSVTAKATGIPIWSMLSVVLGAIVALKTYHTIATSRKLTEARARS